MLSAKKILKNFGSALLGLLILLSPLGLSIALAQNDNVHLAAVTNGTSKKPVTSGNNSDSSGIRNPLGENTGTLSTFVAKILHILFEIGAIVVVFMIILSGFKFVLAQGDPKGITDAKNMLFGTLIGAVILLGAETISQVISNTVKELAK